VVKPLIAGLETPSRKPKLNQRLSFIFTSKPDANLLLVCRLDAWSDVTPDGGDFPDGAKEGVGPEE